MGRQLKTMTEEKEKSLSVQDRCDRCGSQAWVLVKGMNGELLFCGHHYNKVMDDPDGYKKMMAFALTILDERDKLIENKTLMPIPKDLDFKTLIKARK